MGKKKTVQEVSGCCVYENLSLELCWLFLENVDDAHAVDKFMDVLDSEIRDPDDSNVRSFFDVIKDACITRRGVSSDRQDILAEFLKSAPKHGKPKKEKKAGETKSSPKAEEGPKHFNLDTVPTIEQLVKRFKWLHDGLISDNPVKAMSAVPYHFTYLHERLMAAERHVLTREVPRTAAFVRKTLDDLAKIDWHGPQVSHIVEIFDYYKQILPLYDDLVKDEALEEVISELASNEKEDFPVSAERMTVVHLEQAVEYSEDDDDDDVMNASGEETENDELDELASQQHHNFPAQEPSDTGMVHPSKISIAAPDRAASEHAFPMAVDTVDHFA